MSSLLLPTQADTGVEASDGAGSGRVPPLHNGDRLSGSEFMRRYEAMPDTRAELINGIVYMASPVRLSHHGRPHAYLTGWLTLYHSRNPTADIGVDTTVVLDENALPQPDAVLFRIGGKAHMAKDGFIYGPPELVCEVAASTASIDAHVKADAYAAAGVAEYLLWRTDEPGGQQLDWFRLKDDGRYHPLTPDADGILTSTIFAGLRLHRPALLAGDVATVLGVICG